MRKHFCKCLVIEAMCVFMKEVQGEIKHNNKILADCQMKIHNCDVTASSLFRLNSDGGFFFPFFS